MTIPERFRKRFGIPKSSLDSNVPAWVMNQRSENPVLAQGSVRGPNTGGGVVYKTEQSVVPVEEATSVNPIIAADTCTRRDLLEKAGNVLLAGATIGVAGAAISIPVLGIAEIIGERMRLDQRVRDSYLPALTEEQKTPYLERKFVAAGTNIVPERMRREQLGEFNLETVNRVVNWLESSANSFRPEERRRAIVENAVAINGRMAITVDSAGFVLAGLPMDKNGLLGIEKGFVYFSNLGRTIEILGVANLGNGFGLYYAPTGERSALVTGIGFDSSIQTGDMVTHLGIKTNDLYSTQGEVLPELLRYHQGFQGQREVKGMLGLNIGGPIVSNEGLIIGLYNHPMYNLKVERRGNVEDRGNDYQHGPTGAVVDAVTSLKKPSEYDLRRFFI